MSISTYHNPFREYVKNAPSGDIKRFIRRVNELADYKIPNDALFRTYRNNRDFSELWSRLVGDDCDYPFKIAVRLLSVHDDERAAEELIRVWWKVHNIEPDELGLSNAINRASAETYDIRDRWRRVVGKIRRKKAEKRKMNNDKIKAKRPPKTRTRILESLKAQDGTPAEIADRLELDRELVKKQLQRLVKTGYADRHVRGIYSVKGSPVMRPVPIVTESKPTLPAAPETPATTTPDLEDLYQRLYKFTALDRGKFRELLNSADHGLAVIMELINRYEAQSKK
jgi:hypothetical protein